MANMCVIKSEYMYYDNDERLPHHTLDAASGVVERYASSPRGNLYKYDVLR